MTGMRSSSTLSFMREDLGRRWRDREIIKGCCNTEQSKCAEGRRLGAREDQDLDCKGDRLGREERV